MGGSGLSYTDYTTAIKNGIHKINYYSQMANNIADKIANEIAIAAKTGKKSYYHDITAWTIDAVKDEAAKMMRVFNSSFKSLTCNPV